MTNNIELNAGRIASALIQRGCYRAPGLDSKENQKDVATIATNIAIEISEQLTMHELRSEAARSNIDLSQ